MNVLGSDDTPRVHGAEEPADMPQTHAGVEAGDPEPAAVQRGPQESVGHGVGHPQGTRRARVSTRSSAL